MNFGFTKTEKEDFKEINKPRIKFELFQINFNTDFDIQETIDHINDRIMEYNGKDERSKKIAKLLLKLLNIRNNEINKNYY